MPTCSKPTAVTHAHAGSKRRHSARQSTSPRAFPRKSSSVNKQVYARQSAHYREDESVMAGVPAAVSGVTDPHDDVRDGVCAVAEHMRTFLCVGVVCAV